MSITLNDIRKAYLRIKNYVHRTTLLRCDILEKELQFRGKIFLKCEFEQPTGSFKVRGAFNVLTQLSDEEKKRGVITRSSGNFAQAVAYAAHMLDTKATILMPENAPETKLQGTVKYGAVVIKLGTFHEEGEKKVDQLVQEKGFVKLHPYNDYRTMAGQGTAALEILDQLPEIDHFFCPIGGGGLMSGCATALKETSLAIKTYGVEPLGASDYHLSRQSGVKQTLKEIDTIADGLRAPTVGELNYPILNKYVDETVVVRDEKIKKAMKWLYEHMNIVTEPSGATSFAGFLEKASLLQGNVVILLSGKNVDMKNFLEWTKTLEQAF